ncbi:MAG: pyruvate, phosphate dikinase [Oscillospiraceae bacterium]|nr:pyruvate, phosphate dikinase [Oscillospiraceae bacterium]
MSNKYVYLFEEGTGNMREILGGKGANLAEMTSLGMPVPPGFTVSTDACTRYYDDGERIDKEIEAEIFEYLSKLEKITGKKLGDGTAPLLVSVRSGARVSMPGMMDTILNLGINDTVAGAMIQLTGAPRFVYDSYRRFIQMYSDVVTGLPKSNFESYIAMVKDRRGVTNDSELTADDMKELVSLFKDFYSGNTRNTFPDDPKEQLIESVKAVFRSWNNPRAIAYRRMNDIPSYWGTAVTVQSMVFGNMGDDSGTGVAFTRDPATGEKRLYGEFLMNAQGEDVVAGIRTPQTIDQLKTISPEVYKEFAATAAKLELHYKDMQDMEFTIERGKFYMLQTRNGKRTAPAALKVAVDLVGEGMCTKQEALLKIEPKQLDSLIHPGFDPVALKKSIPAATGLAASPGAACGAVYFNPDDAKRAAKNGPVVLVRSETSPEDIEGMAAAEGILTATGGRTSHAAVVARGMGICCVVGCSALRINKTERSMTVGNQKVMQGEFISLDGSTGNVYIGSIPTVEAVVGGYFATIMEWADEIRALRVRTNADTPRDAATALKFGAEGIGLTRTEHMFFDADRIPVMREMIISENTEQRQRALEKLLSMQRSDFEGIFRVMQGRPVTIRLLDPPLHEFLPTADDDIADLADEMGVSFKRLKSTVRSLHEANPMMGYRGCRLSVTYPEIAMMQARAIIEAAISVKRETNCDIIPEIMIPLVCEARELKYVADTVREVADIVIKDSKTQLKYLVGTMIEVPRAALTADEIAKEAEFFSFGTNDLSQLTYAFSRDDSGKFLPYYFEKNLFENDPFEHLDQKGVGKLMDIACKLARMTRSDIHLGICGESGGDPVSIEFCHRIGLSYVSCSPYRVPIARLAAAQSQIKYGTFKAHLYDRNLL